MTTGFHRSKVTTGLITIDTETWEYVWDALELPQLLRKTITNPEDMLCGLYDHIIYELEGDLGDLVKVASTDLLDKKIVKRSTEASLVLDKDLTMGEELWEYLFYVLEIREDKMSGIMGVFNDYAKSVEME